MTLMLMKNNVLLGFGIHVDGALTPTTYQPPTTNSQLLSTPIPPIHPTLHHTTPQIFVQSCYVLLLSDLTLCVRSHTGVYTGVVIFR